MATGLVVAAGRPASAVTAPQLAGVCRDRVPIRPMLACWFLAVGTLARDGQIWRAGLPLVLLLLGVSQMACSGERTLGENPARVLGVGGGGAITPSTFLKGRRSSCSLGQVGSKDNTCALSVMLVSADVKVLPKGIVGALLQPISRCSHRSHSFLCCACARFKLVFTLSCPT
jgi:hypothetical protein